MDDIVTTSQTKGSRPRGFVTRSFDANRRKACEVPLKVLFAQDKGRSRSKALLSIFLTDLPTFQMDDATLVAKPNRQITILY